MKTIGIYTHIPFCLRKCVYCDFLSDVSENFEMYVRALLNEIKASRPMEGFQIDTVYIGGGTPTVLPAPLLCEILEAVKEFTLIKGAEITVEANPGALAPEYLTTLKSQGANRISIGLQATHPELLHILGRAHTKEDFTNNFHAAREAGFDNINIDLMFSLPGQTREHWLDTLQEIIELSPEHISAYSLTPAEGTSLWEQIKSGGLTLPDDATDRDMYNTARRLLTAAGYNHYEISNFAKPNQESLHNINCWRLKPYIGFGLGAHSFDGRARWHNTEDMAEYLQYSGKGDALRKDILLLSAADLAAEAMILGLRLCKGVTEETASPFKNEVSKLVSDGLLACGNGRIALTPYGMDLANRVFAAFL
ncbi:MAG: radical SAM family heme chaperone HemW [Defluviitaleaceae bacterium]|nr:radical SAM family heme chaperone HemW [Defluviitaleaceae bacterium]